MRITVFGATGNVGGRVVAEALARGHQVTAVLRDPAKPHGLPSAAAIAVGGGRGGPRAAGGGGARARARGAAPPPRARRRP
ncbi:NAD(P)H-binding protein, partial [Kitasatospora sp. NPDC059577]|uniref:NAD(P)H-binding protein n=1 Tax=Kitasatospora sp. NPDC059577 TaxID=3346873 RepID=UPI003698FB69